MSKQFDPASIAESNPNPTPAEQATGSSFGWIIFLTIALVVIVMGWPKYLEHRKVSQEEAAQAASVLIQAPVPAEAETPKLQAKTPEVPPQPTPGSNGQADDPWSKFKKP